MYEILEINDKEFACKFGFNALRRFSRLTKMPISQLEILGDKMTLDEAVILIHCGIADGHRAAKKELDYSIDDLADDLDTDMEAIGRAMDIFGNQMGKDRMAGGDKVASNKKKAKAKK